MEEIIEETLIKIPSLEPGCLENTINGDLYKYKESPRNFWNKYCLGLTKDIPMHFSQHRLGESPVYAQFVLTFDKEIPETQKFMLAVISSLQAVLFRNFEQFKDSKNKDNYLTAVLFEDVDSKENDGEESEESDIIKDEVLDNKPKTLSFRIIFPFCVIKKANIESLRIKFIGELTKSGALVHLSERPRVKWNEILLGDNKPFPLYMGCPGKEDSLVHTLSGIYGEVSEYIGDFDPDDEFAERPYERTLEIFKKEYSKFFSAGIMGMNDIKSSETIIPTYFSLHPIDHVTKERILLGDDEENKNSNLYIAKSMIKLISVKRISIKKEWLRIGRALYHATNGSESGLDMWIDYTKRSSKGKPEDCESYYNEEFEETNSFITTNTLMEYASKDSKSKYRDWHIEWYTDALLNVKQKASHADVAKAFYRYRPLKYKCAAIQRKKWYEYCGHGWDENDGGQIIDTELSGSFVETLEKIHKNAESKMMTETERGTVDRNVSKMKTDILSGLIDNLKDESFKSRIMSALSKNFYYDKWFNTAKDDDPALIRTPNCVLECTDEEILVRVGLGEDYLVKKIPTKYVNTFTDKSPKVLKIYKWIHEIFCDKELEHFFLMDMASTLYQRNSHKRFRILSGNGNGSKSMFTNLLSKTLGSDKCVTFPMSVITEKQSGGGASPELSQAEHTNIALFQEPNANVELQEHAIKILTGGVDTVFCRMLYSNGGAITLSFNSFLICNNIPPMLNPTQALKNRVLVYLFGSTWSFTAPEAYEDQLKQRCFKIIENFDSEITGLTTAFLWILVKYFKKYKTEGINKIPSSILKQTESYWKSRDDVNEYLTDVDEIIVPTTDSGDIDYDVGVVPKELLKRYNAWLKILHPSAIRMDMLCLKTEISKNLGVDGPTAKEGSKLKKFWGLSLTEKQEQNDTL